MITLIFGKPGAGKTALMTRLALECMTGKIARKDCKSSKAEIEAYNDGGFSLSTDFEHLVFADYKIQARHGKVRSWDMDGFEYGLPDPKHTTAFLPPYSRLFFDEAQKYLNSRRSELADSVSRAYEFHRHMHYNITLVMLRPKLIDLNVRELSEHVIEVVELEHEYDHDCIVGSVWYCREYDNVAVALKSIDGQSVEYEKTRYEFDGNIYKHYSSFAQAPAFYNGRYASDFTLMDAADYGRSVEDVARFNREHSYALPKGYYE